MIGKRFSFLTVLSPRHNDRGFRLWECICDCGNRRIVSTGEPNAGRAHSCGCMKLSNGRFLKSGISKTKTYRIWSTMLARCRTGSQTSYPRYGAVGISVCERWSNFENFLFDMGEAPHGMEIDRIDSSGNYEPGNCRWATRSQNARNKRNNVYLTLNGETKLLLEWAKQYNLSVSLLRVRLRLGWAVERAILTPVDMVRSDARKKHSEAKAHIGTD